MKLVGILEFVDHDKLELMGEFSSDAFMLAKRPSRLDKQVVVVEHAPFTLGAPVDVESRAGNTEHILEQRLGQKAARLLDNFRAAGLELGGYGLVFFRSEPARGPRTGGAQREQTLRVVRASRQIRIHCLLVLIRP